MDGFEWAENNLDVRDPPELQNRGVNVFFAPNIESGKKVVNLADGSVEFFWPEEHRPESGFFADYESLARYCRRPVIPLTETEGYVSTQPVGLDEAADPLLHGGRTGAGSEAESS